MSGPVQQMNSMQLADGKGITFGSDYAIDPRIIGGASQPSLVLTNGALKFEDLLAAPFIEQIGSGATATLNLGFAGNSVSIDNNSVNIQNLNVDTINGEDVSSLFNQSSAFSDNVEVVNSSNAGLAASNGAFLIQSSEIVADWGTPIYDTTPNDTTKPALASSGKLLYLEKPVGYVNGTTKEGQRLDSVNYPDGSVIQSVDDSGADIQIVLASPLNPLLQPNGSVTGITVLNNLFTLTGTSLAQDEYQPGVVIRVDTNAGSYFYSFSSFGTVIGNIIEGSLVGNNDNITIPGADIIAIYSISPGVGDVIRVYNGKMAGMVYDNDSTLTFGLYDSVDETMSALTGLATINANLSTEVASVAQTLSVGSVAGVTTPFFNLTSANSTSTTIGDSVIDLANASVIISPDNLALLILVNGVQYYIVLNQLTPV